MLKLIITTGLLVTSLVHAGEVIKVSAEERSELLKRAEVWTKPSWFSDDLQFKDAKYDLLENLASSEKEKAISGSRLLCFYDQKLQREHKKQSTGKTPKMYCYLGKAVYNEKEKRNVIEPVTKKDGVTKIDVKVKYQKRKGNNKEIYAELAATRLMSAIGFAADKTFFVPELYCQNCSDDPWNNSSADPGAILLFSSNLTESKFEGTKIENVADFGWEPSELKNNMSRDNSVADIQKTHRDALFLFAAMIQHSDNKGPNQRLVCASKLTPEGTCPENGKVIALLQDVGATFGDGRKSSGYIADSAKMNLKGWSSTRVWKDAEKCVANQHAVRATNDDGLFPVISEAGRRHLAKLLTALSQGEAGRKRLEQIFEQAQVQELKTTASAWADALQKKIQAIENPLCEIDASQCGQVFKGCPQ